LRNRATGHAYEPIIASGTNANVLHYNDNNQVCKSGDLILMDFCADYANYCADLSRTIPVNGKFTPRQKDVYNAVLSVFKQAKEMLNEGNNLDTYHKAVGEVMQEELIKLGLLNAAEVKNQVADQPLYKRYFMHGTSHYLGLDVHDVGSRFAEMKAGMVFTCEPGIYIPEEGFGIRIENDILLTETGNVDLMESIPIEADHIEDIMQSFR
jgi:Xaa-Pro aminopeptidase